MQKIIHTELIGCHYDNFLAKHFEINKTDKLAAKKYYWPTFCQNVKIYIKNKDVYLAAKAICHKRYKNLQLFYVLMHQ